MFVMQVSILQLVKKWSFNHSRQAVLRLHIYGATLLQGGSLIGCPSRPVVGNSALLRHLMLLTRTSPIKVVANGRQGVRDMSL